jgi:hypothetical protein
MHAISDAIERIDGHSQTVRKTWRLPTDVAQLLHQWSEAETGSQDNIGMLVTRAIDNRDQTTSWTPRNFEEVDTTPTGFRAAQSSITKFTSHVNDEYGQELANCLMAEYYRAHDITDDEPSGDVDITSVTTGDELELTESQLNTEFSNVDPASIDYKTRRGLELARVRHEGRMNRAEFYEEFEQRFDLSRRSARKDLRKLTEELPASMMVSPVEQLKQEVDCSNSLAQRYNVETGDEPVIIDKNGERWEQFVQRFTDRVSSEVQAKDYTSKRKPRKEQLRDARNTVDRTQELQQLSNDLLSLVREQHPSSESELIELRNEAASKIARIRRAEYVNGHTLHERSEAEL